MKASEALKITEEAINTPLYIEQWLKQIYRSIELAAKAGKRSIVHPFTGVRMTYPTTEQARAIWIHLQNDGYKITHHPDPDPGHPASAPYTSIEW